MGFAVNGQCYETMIQAQDAFFGGSKPIITAEGQPLFFKRESNGWSLNGEIVETSFPTCSVQQNFADGALYGSYIFGVVVVLILVGLVGKQFK